jgi:hypothetical protein
MMVSNSFVRFINIMSMGQLRSKCAAVLDACMCLSACGIIIIFYFMFYMYVYPRGMLYLLCYYYHRGMLYTHVVVSEA